MRPILFIDDGGVLNDNSLRENQWARLLGQFFPPILGGTPEQWEEANKLVFPRLFAESLTEWEYACLPYEELWTNYAVAWLNGMCELVGVPLCSEEECVAIEAEAGAYVSARVRAAFPGAAEAVRALRDAGYVLHMASAANSWWLAGYLEGMGIGDCFQRLYGSDLIDLFKAGPEWYERIFADAGVDPRDAVVVDDHPKVAGWAADVGARVVLVSPVPADVAAASLVIPSLAALPSVINLLD